jgi:hypothetical protein
VGHLVWLVPDPRGRVRLLHEYVDSSDIVTALADGTITQVAVDARTSMQAYPMFRPRPPIPVRRRTTTRSFTRRNRLMSRLFVDWAGLNSPLTHLHDV